MTLPVSVPTVPEWQFCRVRWEISDYGGTPVAAIITFSSAVEKVQAARKTLVRQFPPALMVDGILRNVNGDPWVDLVATLDTDISPHDWTITAIATLPDGQRITATFVTPVNGDIDLNSQVVVSTSTGIPIVRGRGVDTITAVNTTAYVTYTDGTTSTYQLPAGPPALFDVDAVPYLNATPPLPTGPGVQPASRRLVTEASTRGAGAKLALGATPAASGTVRLEYGASIALRNAANTGDSTLLASDANGQTLVDVGGQGTVIGQHLKFSNPAERQALGTAAAATLGATGGTGPATAAQNGWLVVFIGGTPYYIPIWT